MADKIKTHFPHLATLLWSRRKQLNIAQGDMAIQLGMSRPNLSYIESGQRRLKPHEIEKFAHAYRISLGELTSANENHVVRPRDRQGALCDERISMAMLQEALSNIRRAEEAVVAANQLLREIIKLVDDRKL